MKALHEAQEPESLESLFLCMKRYAVLRVLRRSKLRFASPACSAGIAPLRRSSSSMQSCALHGVDREGLGHQAHLIRSGRVPHTVLYR